MTPISSTRRRYPGQRGVHIALRTAHIGAAGVVVGGVTLGVDSGSWPIIAGLTGVALVADDVFRYGEDWIRYVQSWAILAKLALLWFGIVEPALLGPAIWGALIVGGVISHAPGKIRQAAIWGPSGPCAARAATPRPE